MNCPNCGETLMERDEIAELRELKELGKSTKTIVKTGYIEYICHNCFARFQNPIPETYFYQKEDK